MAHQDVNYFEPSSTSSKISPYLQFRWVRVQLVACCAWSTGQQDSLQSLDPRVGCTQAWFRDFARTLHHLWWWCRCQCSPCSRVGRCRSPHLAVWQGCAASTRPMFPLVDPTPRLRDCTGQGGAALLRALPLSCLTKRPALRSASAVSSELAGSQVKAYDSLPLSCPKLAAYM